MEWWSDWGALFLMVIDTAIVSLRTMTQPILGCLRFGLPGGISSGFIPHAPDSCRRRFMVDASVCLRALYLLWRLRICCSIFLATMSMQA